MRTFSVSSSYGFLEPYCVAASLPAIHTTRKLKLPPFRVPAHDPCVGRPSPTRKTQTHRPQQNFQLFPQEVTDAELLALAGPSQGNVEPALRLSSVVADSARRWLAATDDADSSDISSIEDGSNSSNQEARLDEEATIM